tara:strand:+ start:406 stop:600 length:195 start_codon:yes stop_codon:yes gene_type:complete
MPYHDDNFGEWEGMEPSDPDFEDNVRFYKRVQKESVLKTCDGCGRKVRLRPDYAYCNACADMNY